MRLPAVQPVIGALSVAIAAILTSGFLSVPGEIPATSQSPEMSEGTEHVPAMLSTFSAGIQPTKQSPAWSMPVRANTPVSGSFGEVGRYWPGGHAGIDFNGTQGDPIFAATDGRVTFASFHSGGYGNLIFVMRGDGTQTRYAHLHRIQVRVGDRVKAGQRIGRMGSSGQATGTHLHFEVRVGPGLTPTHPQSLWSGRRPGVARTPPAWSCAKYGGCR